MTGRVDTPVVVIGAGPAGLVASLLLSSCGVRHVLVEKYHSGIAIAENSSSSPRSRRISTVR